MSFFMIFLTMIDVSLAVCGHYSITKRFEIYKREEESEGGG